MEYPPGESGLPRSDTTGFAVGAVLAGVLADAFGVRAAVWAVAALTVVSGLVVAVRMHETLAARRRVA